MPSLKVFIDSSTGVTDADLRTLSELVITGLEAHGEEPAIVVVPGCRVNLSGCYAELTCRHKPNRTPELRQKLAVELEKTAREIFGLEDPVRVRIIMLEQDLLSAMN